LSREEKGGGRKGSGERKRWEEWRERKEIGEGRGYVPPISKRD